VGFFTPFFFPPSFRVRLFVKNRFLVHVFPNLTPLGFWRKRIIAYSFL
jgi:hypothetical protein